MAFWKDSMINRLLNLNNRNRATAKMSQVLCSNLHPSRGGGVGSTAICKIITHKITLER